MTTATQEASGRTEDDQLVEAVRAGDDAAFAELYRRYHPRVAAYIRRMVRDHGRSEDVAQDTFLNALRRMRATEGPIAFRPWIFEIARNASIDLHRRASRTDEVSIDAEGGLAPADSLRLIHASGPDRAVLVNECLEQIQGAFDGLSDTHHRILVMRELEGLSYAEIGRRTGLTRPAVESALFRARRRLEQEYAEIDTGVRCDATGRAIARLAEGVESRRDRRLVARHVRRCSACRCQAAALDVRPGAALRIAGLLPLPLAWKRRRHDGDLAGSSGQAGHVAGTQGAATWLPAAAHAAESVGGAWGKTAIVIAAAVIAGGGGAAVITSGLTGVGSPGVASESEGSSEGRGDAATAIFGPGRALDPFGPALLPGAPQPGVSAPGGTGDPGTIVPGESGAPPRAGSPEGAPLPTSGPGSDPAPGVPAPAAPRVDAPAIESPRVDDPTPEQQAPQAPAKPSPPDITAPRAEAPEPPAADAPKQPQAPSAPPLRTSAPAAPEAPPAPAAGAPAAPAAPSAPSAPAAPRPRGLPSAPE